ncbi:hypothetical protein [Fischerella sp.]|nr:hypothetical protein [Fischerella sp.]
MGYCIGVQDSHAPGRTAKNENLSSNAQCPTFKTDVDLRLRSL